VSRRGHPAQRDAGSGFGRPIPEDASGPACSTGGVDQAIDQRRDELLRRFYAREGGLDGAFLVGVRSTGIYCLPSCPARKPKPENVVVLPADGEDEARALGLRACRRCRPDLFARGIDPDEERAARLAQAVRRRPGDFPDVAAAAGWLGVGTTKLNALTRAQSHLSPAALLSEARLEHAAEALARGRGSVLDAALDAGFESSSAFHENFRARYGATPRAFRALGALRGDEEAVLSLPSGFDPEDLLSFFGRDANGVCERRAGARAEKALVVDGRPLRVALDFAPGRLRYRLRANGALPPTVRFRVHRLLARQLGLAQDPATFERRAARLGFASLIAGRRGARVPLAAVPYEALVWAIVGQQVNLAFAATCRARLVALAGVDVGDGLRAHPDPARVAALEPAELERLQLTRRKAETLVGTARALAAGDLALDAEGTEPAGRLQRGLLVQRGLGPWTVRYVLLRGLGFGDVVPVGDAGLAAALQRTFALAERPDAHAQERLLAPFTPHRSLATHHLWRSLSDPPEPDRPAPRRRKA